jgi:hypothetical protein
MCVILSIRRDIFGFCSSGNPIAHEAVLIIHIPLQHEYQKNLSVIFWTITLFKEVGMFRIDLISEGI